MDKIDKKILSDFDILQELFFEGFTPTNNLESGNMQTQVIDIYGDVPVVSGFDIAG